MHIYVCRTVDGGFPDCKEIKKRVRDSSWPDRNLGHIDKWLAKWEERCKLLGLNKL